MSHYGYLRTIQTHNDLQKHIEDIQRHLDMLNGDGSWMGVSFDSNSDWSILKNLFWVEPAPGSHTGCYKSSHRELTNLLEACKITHPYQLEKNKIRSRQLAFEAQLHDPEFLFRSIGFTNFLSTWLIRQVDPKKTHPNPPVQYAACIFTLRSSVLF